MSLNGMAFAKIRDFGERARLLILANTAEWISRAQSDYCLVLELDICRKLQH